ncbi:protein CROC-4 [Sarcophilus harrisii]|uniref:protein CROC-4 n=1 Tax=Sarcophilus harrisii TaxID=9305 RepID=UPI001301C275|nr:protein CROC-4 [Sarcophilus harrisii]
MRQSGMGFYFLRGEVFRQWQHPLFAVYQGELQEKEREGSEIPEWIDRCYVIRAAASTPQEARSWGGEKQTSRGGLRDRHLLFTGTGFLFDLVLAFLFLLFILQHNSARLILVFSTLDSARMNNKRT